MIKHTKLKTHVYVEYIVERFLLKMHKSILASLLFILLKNRISLQKPLNFNFAVDGKDFLGYTNTKR